MSERTRGLVLFGVLSLWVPIMAVAARRPALTLGRVVAFEAVLAVLTLAAVRLRARSRRRDAGQATRKLVP